jgi:internalin A
VKLFRSEIERSELTQIEEVVHPGLLKYSGRATDVRLATNLDETRVTDAGLVILAGIPTLQRLHLDGTPISDAGLAALQDAHALAFVSVRRTKISHQAIRAFRAARPKVELDEPIEAAAIPD